ncbi:rCG25500 [Rattus norvegicus]|uniref:RCG25500 n=1 Tax=Rattus norvegicus TaxID=10116 RepID=A6I4B7_RAT|nr:rCG25500 [Rattus norvegicus]
MYIPDTTTHPENWIKQKKEVKPTLDAVKCKSGVTSLGLEPGSLHFQQISWTLSIYRGSGPPPMLC